MANNEDRAVLNVNWSNIALKSGGVIDRAATLEMLAEDLDEHIATHEMPREKIAAAVAAVYEANPKTSFDLGSLSTRIITYMKDDVKPGTESKVAKQLADYVRSESAQTTAFVKGEVEQPGLYVIRKGAGGGVSVCTDSVLGELKKAHAAKLAKAAS